MLAIVSIIAFFSIPITYAQSSGGALDTTFNVGAGFDGNVHAIAIQDDGMMVVGGVFTTYQGDSANRIIRLNPDGSRDASFEIGAGFNNRVSSIIVQDDGKIVAGGFFITYQGDSANNIIRLNSDGTRDTSFEIGDGFNNTLRSITIQDDGKILVVGNFTSYQGDYAGRIIRLNPDGSRDASFDTGGGFNNTAQAVAVQDDGKIVVGGFFTSYQGDSANNIIRLNSDGTRDTSFEIGTGIPNGAVRAVTLQDDGKILVGGSFTTYQGDSANRILRLNPDGSRDASFEIGTGFNNAINQSIVLQDDGKIVTGGAFNTYQGEPAPRIVRLISQPIVTAPPTTRTRRVVGSRLSDQQLLSMGITVSRENITATPQPTQDRNERILELITAFTNKDGSPLSDEQYNDFVEQLRDVLDLPAHVETPDTISADTHSCPVFYNYMKLGDRDGQLGQRNGMISQISRLQRVLRDKGHYAGSITGIFDALTYTAVKAWQASHRDAVLVPWGITQPSGFFYQSSVHHMNQILGCHQETRLDNGVVLR